MLSIGENASAFGKYNLDVIISLGDVSCWKDAVGTGLSLGTFIEETATCVSNTETKAYIKYNSPVWNGISTYTTNYSQFDMFYVFKEGADMCWTKAETDYTQCTPSIGYDSTELYP